MESIFLMGFFIGMHHALEADHLAAISSILTNKTNASKSRAIRHGLFWGFGHTITLAIMGFIFVSLNQTVPESLAANLEFIVGIMLLGLGIHVVYRLVRDKIHFHYHEHRDGTQHFHAHSHKNVALDNHEHQHSGPIKSLLVGLMHGLAGSAVLILLTMDHVSGIVASMLYIALFGLGSIIGMGLLSFIISVPLKASQKLTALNSSLTSLIGVLTCLVGLNIVFSHLTS